MLLIQEVAQQVAEQARDPFWYGVGVSALGAVVLLFRAVRGKAYSKIQAALGFGLIIMGAAISFGMLERVIEPVMKIVEKFAG